MSVTYPDLTNDFPDVTSDVRYLFRDMAIDDVPFVVQYENLLNALKNAADGATDVSSYQEEWNALLAFKGTDEYKNHVAPLNMTAEKFQTIEDKTISSQRFAKRQKQQWIISETQPEENTQAVDDIWFRVDEITEDNLVNATPFYKGEDGFYHEFTVSPNMKFSSEEDINNIVNGNTATNPEAVLNNQSLKNYVVSHDREYEEYKRSIEAELTSVKKDTAGNADNIAKNMIDIEINKKDIATYIDVVNTNKQNIATMQSTINTMSTEIKALKVAISDVAVSESGVFRTGVISGGETQEYLVTFSKTFKNVPTVSVASGSGNFDVSVVSGSVTQASFKFRIKSNRPGTEYDSWIDVSWAAVANV